MSLGMEVGLRPGNFVLDGDPAPPPPKKGAQPPIFGPCLLYSQTSGWIKMPLGTEVGLGPGDFVLDGDPVPPAKKQRRAQPPIFGPCLL